MKKIKFAAIAIAAMGLTVACNNQPANEDSTADTLIEEIVEVDTIDTVEEVAEEPVAEEPVKKNDKKVSQTKNDKAPIVTGTKIDENSNANPSERAAAGKKVDHKVTTTTIEGNTKSNPTERAKRN